MNVLSLFDGISCGRVALERSGLNINTYLASEIDPYAITIGRKHYPDTIHVGDITKLQGMQGIDLLIGGSPCQGFSFAGKKLNFDDPRSLLFFEYYRVLKETKPTYFLLENVKMMKESEQVITDFLGVEPIEINSSLVSAQHRVRNYWTNIPNIEEPQDRGIHLLDILENDTYIYPAAIRGREDKRVKRDDGKRKWVQCLEVKSTHDKSHCLTTVSKNNVLTSLPIGVYPDAYNTNLPFRYYTPLEYERLQTLPDNYTEGVSVSQRHKLVANGWTVDVLTHLFNCLHKSLNNQVTA